MSTAPVETLVDQLGAEGGGSRTLRSVVIVHDYLNQRGGAEKVVLEMSNIWPEAPIYTSLYRPDSTFAEFRERDIRTSFLDRLPVDRGFRNLFPIYPAAFRSLGELAGNIVVASSSGWSHIARVARGGMHVVYCHTPARWLYRADYLNAGGRRSRRQEAIRPVASAFRRIDRRAARRADLYIANSRAVQRLIRSSYGIDAPVVHPPVDIDRFSPRPRGDRLLVISRLLPYKRVDLVVSAATRLRIGLDVVGDGPMLNELREIAGADVMFHRSASDATVAELMEGCRAVCVAGEEDFGIVAVEAQAAGKPVVAYGRGGALETVEEHLTGVFFREQTVDSLVAAITASEGLDTPAEVIAERARRFGVASFRQNLVAAILARQEQAV